MKMNKKILVPAICCAALLIAVIALVVAESLAGNRIKIVNDGSRDVSVRLYFVDEELGELDELYNCKVPAGETFKTRYDGDFLFSGYEAMLAYDVLYDGEECATGIADGAFTGYFSGAVKMRFYEEDGAYYLTSKATTGLFGSTANTDLDSGYVIYPDVCDWDYIY